MSVISRLPIITACTGIFLLMLSALLFIHEKYSTPPIPIIPSSVNLETDIASALDEVIQHLEKEFVNETPLKREEMHQIAVDAILKKIGDQHGKFLTNDEYGRLKDRMTPTHYGGLNIRVAKHLSGNDKAEILILEIFDGSPVGTFGVRPGDTISHVNGIMVTPDNWEDMVKSVRGPIGSDVRITVKRDSRVKLGELTFQRVRSKLQTIFAHHENCYMHLRISLFINSPEQQVFDAVEPILKECDGGVRGIVLDVRNNPGGSLLGAIKLVDMFLDPDDVVVKTIGRAAENNMTYKAEHEAVFPKSIPMVALINGRSASASEILVGALKKYRTLFAVLGEKSYGKGSVQTVFPVNGGTSAVKITTAIYLAGGTIEIDGVGIKPNVEVKQTITPGQTDMQRVVNTTLILNSMNPAVDHQLRMGYHFVAHLANNKAVVSISPDRGVLQALESVEAQKPVVVTGSLCREAGLRGCPRPREVLQAPSFGTPGNPP